LPAFRACQEKALDTASPAVLYSSGVNRYSLTGSQRGVADVGGGRSPEGRLEQSIELGTLCACYGGLLTGKQRRALLMHCNEDLSLAEIAGEMNVSRQNVHELILRSEQKLHRYEAALGLAEQARATRAGLAAAVAALDAGRPAESRALLAGMLNSLDEEEAPDGV
jgi:uncharacterized protein